MRSSSINSLLVRHPKIKCPFEKGGRYTLLELHRYLRLLETTRQSDNELTTALRTLPPEFKEVFDELYPLNHLVSKSQISLDNSHFVWALTGKLERGIDFVLCEGEKTRFLQITVSGPMWPEANPPYDNPGYAKKLMLEELNAEGMVRGWGPPRNVRGRIVFADEGGRRGDKVREAFRVGIIKAYDRKRHLRTGVECELVVELDCTYGLTQGEFRSIVDKTRPKAPLDAFMAIYILGIPDGHFASIERTSK